MSDEDRTEPNQKLIKYLQGDAWLDRHLAPLTSSPATLAIVIVWTVACVGFGFWIRG